MLDLEVFEEPTVDGLDVVSLPEMKLHMRISPTQTHLDAQITSAIQEVVDALGGRGGVLNRTILKTTWRLFLNGYPASRSGQRQPILLPFPPLVNVIGITVEDGASPPNVMDPATYSVSAGTWVGQISSIGAWPVMSSSDRALSVVYEAGYDTGKYPKQLKRLVKLLAAHWMENPEATINEPRQMMVNRAIEFGYKQLIDSLRVSVSYDDWNNA